MSVIGDSATIVGGSQGEVTVRVSRRDRRLVRAALAIIAVLAVTDAVLYLSQLI
ncbi:hypothetical protein [Pinisolibacter aquiterrae]|jgi:hypothetical protein|uniref:hypothetical protein n=1 Tax=Pinisolibacter aquiterrae TaxID=2815579 RepID=UPI001C3DB6A4|nr:hypothetical protein [Pinisolibacter aquiterrae]MBV5265967.1 hypothetical protein [Pinisolibacter aquiterrae]MCC8237176.1 hypothetical protein [Pinisolibacter aquiterrae]